MTAGYHRYFTHKSYQCGRLLQSVFIFFGSGTFQKSVIEWVSKHRIHHQLTDTEQDPYNAKLGFWWAHLGWVISKGFPLDFKNIPDLIKDPLLSFQRRYYYPLAVFAGMVLPTLLAWIWDDPWGGLLVINFLGLVLLYHMTFLVNSWAHYFGDQPYIKNSARRGWLIGFPTLGEGGDHNFHHAFSWDYRAGGHEWYRIDPTKWMLWMLSYVGLVWNLRRVAPERIRHAKEEMIA